MKRLTTMLLTVAILVGVGARASTPDSAQVNDWDPPFPAVNDWGPIFDLVNDWGPIFPMVNDWDPPFDLANAGTSGSCVTLDPFARVDAAGLITVGSGVTSVERLSAGMYRVILDRAANFCAFLAQSHDLPTALITAHPALPPGESPSDGLPEVFGRTLYVLVWTPGGDPIDAGFDLVSRCVG